MRDGRIMEERICNKTESHTDTRPMYVSFSVLIFHPLPLALSLS